MFGRAYVCLCVLWLIFSPSAAALDGDTLEVVVMDVGQGDGIYIHTPNGKHILIDAGQDARRGILPFLRSRQVERIDVMVATHPHADHMGGAVAVMEYCDVLRVLDSGRHHTTPNYAEMLSVIRDRGIDYKQPRAGDKLAWDPALKVTVLHPDRADYENINDNSIVIKVVYGKISFLFTGDAEEEAEEVILSSFSADLAADVLKVGHHGSRTSSHPPFLNAVRPRYALISCGRNNSFRHPRQETLDHLEAVDANILRTDEDGFLTFKTDGKTIKWSRSQVPFPAVKFDPGAPEDLGSEEWSGSARRQAEGVALSAEPGENIWANAISAPRWTRPAPGSEKWSCAVSLTPAEGYKTEAGLILMQDKNNFVLLGIQEERMTSLTVVRDGRVSIGPEVLVHRPSRIGFRKTPKALKALAYDDGKKVWRVLWSLNSREAPHVDDRARLGVYVKSWGQAGAEASFKEFRLNSGD